MHSRPNDVLPVTGHTVPVKTTALYSILKQLATQQVNVCTIEDPIELIEPSFNQMQVNAAIVLSFVEGGREWMR